LPLAWDTFTEPYISRRKGDAIQDPKQAMTSAQFIGILKEEYDQCTVRAQGPESTSGQTTNLSMPMPGNLASRIGGRPQNAAGPSHGQNANNNTRMYCCQCGLNNHNTNTCRFLGARSSIYCDNCEKYGHKMDKCWRRDGNNALRRKRKCGNSGDGGSGKGKKKAKAERANAATEESNVAATNIEEKAKLTFVVEEGGVLFDETEVGQYSGFDDYDPLSGNDYRLLWYDWVADSATMSHIYNAHEAFAEYSPADGITVAGVGNTKMSVTGHGMVKLRSRCKGQEYNLRLENVLHIPSNRNNLLALGRWEKNSQTYTGKNGILMLNDAKGKAIAKGKHIENNLYKMQFQPRDKIKTNFNMYGDGTHTTFSSIRSAGLGPIAGTSPSTKNIVQVSTLSLRRV
jgi:hypothetical protein